MGQSASKEKFRESVTALIQVDVSADDAEFWDELWKIPSSAEEVFELLPPIKVRQLRDDRFDNLGTLFTQAVAQLCQIVETPYNIYFDQALNCVRVLTRILPFILEKGDLGDADENVEQLCWGTGANMMLSSNNNTAATTTTMNNNNNNNNNNGNNNNGNYNNMNHPPGDERIGLVIGTGDNNESHGHPSTGSNPVTAATVNEKQRQSAAASNSLSNKLNRSSSNNNNNTNSNKHHHHGHGHGNNSYNNDSSSNIIPDDQEPLALLIVHAAMHMLFLPQFTCDFYEDNTTNSNSNNNMNNHSNSNAPPTGNNNANTTKHSNNNNNSSKNHHHNNNKSSNNNNHNNTSVGKGGTTVTKQQPAKKETKDDRDLKAEAGLVLRKVDWGVSLEPTPTSIIWSAGAGVTTAELGFDANTRKYDKNRIEVLRLLLTAFCDPLFSPADEYNPLASRWLAVGTAADAPNAICLFYSLLNTILSHDPRVVMPVAAGFSEGNHIKLVELSVQLLVVLLDCGLPGNPDPVVDKNDRVVVDFKVASKCGFNMFRTLLARMDSVQDLTYVYDGFTRLLRNVYESESTYSITGTTKLECYQELLVLFWKILEENPLFMIHILNRCNINEIIVPICYLMYKSRRDPAHIGLVHICTFVLLKLSGERSFGVSLNKPFTKKLPTDLPLFHGCHTDLLVITLHKLVVNGAYKLVPLYSCFLTVMSNISPYWKSMSLVAAVKLVNLFELFSSPKFLYSGEHAYRHLSLILEVFNNIIQYQYHGNTHLVYAIVRRKDAFGVLAALTLERAQAQCHKVYGDQATVARDSDSQGYATKIVTIETKAIPGITGAGGGGIGGSHDDASNVSSTAGTPFHPTEEWIRELKENLPLETVARLLQHLVPVVDDIVANKQGIVDEQEILDVLNEITMVGLLPVPHPIVIRKYQPNQYTALWFTAFMWGVIFVRNQKPLPLFDGRTVELFQVAIDDNDDDEDDDD